MANIQYVTSYFVNLYYILQDFDTFQIKTNREYDLRSREIKSIKEKWVKGHDVSTKNSLTI